VPSSSALMRSGHEWEEVGPNEKVGQLPS